MAAKPDKPMFPAYVSFVFFNKFINDLRDGGVPLKIDRSVMPTASGSGASSMMASLRFLQLTDGEDKPTPMMHKLVAATDEERGDIFRSVVQNSYGFLLDDPEFHIEKATGNQVAERFRGQNISGSTVTKSIAFFLAIAKAAGLKVSAHVKPPAPPRGSARRSSKRKGTDVEEEVDYEDAEPELRGDFDRFQIPIPGRESATVIVPRGLTGEDWDMLHQMLALYVKRLQASTKANDGKE